MFERDLLVAVIAFGLGIILLMSAISNSETVFQSPKGEFLTRKLGRRHARIVVGAVGTFVLFMGYILVAPYLFRSFKDSPPTTVPQNGTSATLAVPSVLE